MSLSARAPSRSLFREASAFALGTALLGLFGAAGCGVDPEIPGDKPAAVVHEALTSTATTGNTPWMILLCKASDAAAEPEPPSFYVSQFSGHNAASPSVWDYFWTVSNYTVNLFNTVVSPRWHTTSKTVADLQKEPRDQKLRDCIAAAGVDADDPSRYYGIIAVYNTNFSFPGGTNFGDSGAVTIGQANMALNGNTQPYAGIVMEPWAFFPSFLTHEMGHGYGLEHAFSTASCGAVTQAGEYCDYWDAMGVSGGGYEFSQPAWALPGGGLSWAGPGMNAFNLEKLGWIPRGRQAIVYDSGDHTYSITSLSAPNAQGFFSIKIPVGADPNHFITVEYRRRLGWDAGIPQDAVLIHEVKSDYVPNHQLPLSYLQTKSTNPNDANWKPGEIFSDVTGNYHVRVLALDPVANLASIEVWQGSALPPPSCVSSLSCAHTGWGPPEMTVACTTTVNFYTSITTGVVATGTYYTTDANTPGPTVTACNGPLSSSSSSCTSFSGTVSLAQWCGLPPPPPPPPKTCQGEATPKSKCSAVWHCCGTDGWSCGLCQ